MSESGEKMIKVLHIIDSLGYGGAEKLLYSNLRYMDKEHFSSAVVCLMPQTDLKAKIERLGVPVYDLSLKSRLSFITGISALSGVIKKFSPDILHTHCWAANVMGRAAGRINKVKVVSSLHNAYYEKETLIDSPKYTYHKMLFDKFLDRFTARFFTEKFIAVSQYVKDVAVKQFRVAPDNIRVIYNSIDTEYFTKGLENFDKAEFLSRLGIEEGAPIILSVGSIVPQKGNKYMVMAMSEVVKAVPNAKLVLCGEGWMKDALAEMSRDLGIENNIVFAGLRSDVRKLYELCDIFLFTSLFEGFGIVVCEAMAMSKPVVTFRQPPLTEIISSDEFGVLVEPGDWCAIAREIIALLEKPAMCSDIGKRASMEVRDRFDVRKKTQELEGFYKELVFTD